MQLSCKGAFQKIGTFMEHVNDKNMLYFYCVTQCFSQSLITHKLKFTAPFMEQLIQVT